MHRIRISLAILPLALTLSLYAQDAAAAPQNGQPVLTIKRNSHLVVLDVVVTDNKQNPIAGLKASDFTILENKKPQTILNFDEHGPSAQTAPLPPMPNLPPNTFTNYTAVPQDGPLNILLFDAVNTSLMDQAAVRSQMLKYLNAMPQGTRVAIFTLTTHLSLLQGFTSDPYLLRASLGDKNLPKGFRPSDNSANAGNPGNAASSTPVTAFNSGGLAAGATFHEEDLQDSLRTQYTLDGMNALAHYLAGFAGRKNLVWFGSSFPLNIDPSVNNLIHGVGMNSFQVEFRETVDLLTQDQIAVYPVNARGEERLIAPVFSAANGARGEDLGDLGVSTSGRKNAGNQMVMDEIADSTGGKTFANNDMAGAVKQALALGSHYYTITYTPTNESRNGEYRGIEVKVDQPDLQLYFRHGYYADDPDRPLPGAVATVPPSAMGTAMLAGAPNPTQIIFAAQIVPVSLTPVPAAAPGNDPGPKVKGPYLDYAVHYGIDPRNIVPQITPDGVQHGRLEITALLYDTDGMLVNSISNTATVALDDRVLQQGLHITQTLSVPVDPKKKHDYFFRIGVHDVNGDRVGALEVSVSAIHDPAVAGATPPAN